MRFPGYDGYIETVETNDNYNAQDVNRTSRPATKACKGKWYEKSTGLVYDVVVIYVPDSTYNDGLSLIREIDAYTRIHKKILDLSPTTDEYSILSPVPCLLGYRKNSQVPGRSYLVVSQVTGPNFATHINQIDIETSTLEDRLYCIYLLMKRVQQLNNYGIRHNDIKPENAIIDKKSPSKNSDIITDVKIINLGSCTAPESQVYCAGSGWYESPEFKIVRACSKFKIENIVALKQGPYAIGCSSDIWGLALTTIEYIAGFRISDVCHGIVKPFRCALITDEGRICWSVDPGKWLITVRKVLFKRIALESVICQEICSWIWNNCMTVNTVARAPLKTCVQYIHSLIVQLKSRRK